MPLLNFSVFRTFHNRHSSTGVCRPPLAVFLNLCLYFLLVDTTLGGQSIKTLEPTPPTPSRGSVSLDPGLAQLRSLLDQGKALEAEPLLRAYLATHPDSAEAHFLLGVDLFRQIQERARDTGSMPPAQSAPGTDAASAAKASLAEFTTGAQYGKPTPFDLKIVGLDYILLGDYPDADKWLTKMLDWTPNDSEGWYYLGRTKYNENRFQEAVSSFQQSLKLDPKNVKTEDNLGLAFAGLGRADDALAAYHTAMEWQTDAPAKNPGPFIDLADLLLDQNRSAEAIPYLHEAIQIAPHDSKAHELLGKAYSRLDRLAEAQAELEKAAELAPQNANLPCMLGPIYRKQGLTEKARLALDRCASLNGTHSSPENPRP
jgi:Flp pilus assembly protein TadD